MTREELAELLNVSRNTLNNWEKEKPELVKLINLGLSVEDQIEEAERHLEKLKEMKKKATSSNKFKLK
ncbi:helix-turn-helix domain-containing protein [Sulfuricurvum sp.]|uniref:helix-turn-helix domain-containing protein n=1 Tax=Sulfuricurvum sp. TaxID=2025608 RepID=UPI003BB69737